MGATREELAPLVARLAGLRVLVVGDLVLDEYLTGRPARVSREAPVLVLDEVEREYRVGSAGNPASNIGALGSHATLIGVLGTDAAGHQLTERLAALGIGDEGLLRVAGGQTATKTRILAQGYTGGLYGRQQVLRLDRVPVVLPEQAARCGQALAQLAGEQDAILLSDYRAGVIGEHTIGAARASGRLLAVDSQGDVSRFRGADLVKLNQAEAQVALGSSQILEQADALRRGLEIGALVITLGADGMALFDETGSRRLPALAVSEVFDVTGAGDTVIAVLTLGLAAGLRLDDSAALANAAASVVVRRLGAATVSPAELRDALPGIP